MEIDDDDCKERKREAVKRQSNPIGWMDIQEEDKCNAINTTQVFLLLY
jgi:hypothetical protein